MYEYWNKNVNTKVYVWSSIFAIIKEEFLAFWLVHIFSVSHRYIFIFLILIFPPIPSVESNEGITLISA